MLNIYVTRHWQDKDNERWILNWHRDFSLTKIGQDQAKEVSEKLKKMNIILDKVYSSPLQRTYQTAKIIAKDLKIKDIEKNELLIERDFGVITWKPIEEIQNMNWNNFFRVGKINYCLRGINVETFSKAKIRAKKIIQNLLKKHKSGNILLVTHGDFWKMLYAVYYDIDRKQALQNFHFGNWEVILLSKNIDKDNAHIVSTEQFNI